MRFSRLCFTMALGALAVPFLPTALAAPVDDGFVLLQGGAFTMGSPESERQRQADETQHSVTLSPFYLSPFEITQKAYMEITGVNPSNFHGDNLPVENVTWYDAVHFCNALSEKQGLKPAYVITDTQVTWDRSANGYRLPSEAEWEYAARAGTTTVFHDGEQITSEQANFAGKYPYLIEENYAAHKNKQVVISTSRGETMEVNTLAPNTFGLYHMQGNVAEWCFDYYGDYGTAAAQDPAGKLSGSLRVNRGGSWNDYGKHLRSAYRSVKNPSNYEPTIGLRLARNAEPLDQQVVTTYNLEQIKMPEQPKVLVAYFSYSGNTEKVAKLMANKLKATLFHIAMQNPYRGNIFDVSQRDLNKNARPALRAQVKNIEQYDVILLGYPTWWGTLPMPVFSFLDRYDLSGKIILPFASHENTIFGDSLSDLAKAEPQAYVGQGFEFFYSGGSDLSGELLDWLTDCGVDITGIKQ